MSGFSNTSTMIEDRIESLTALPVHHGVAFRLIELGKDADVEIDEYAQVVQTDAGVSGKLLALANSSWFGVRCEVTTVKHATSLLGINNVRALVASYCLAAFYSAWELGPEDSRAYWEASLCKGAAAKVVARSVVPDRLDEAFVGGLLQDIGIGLLISIGDGTLAARLREPGFNLHNQLDAEYSDFGLDHARCGRLIAEKVQIPKLYLDVISFHHDYEELAAALGDKPLALSVYLASILPHDIRSCKPSGMSEVQELLERHSITYWPSAATLLEEVHAEFRSLVSMLSHGSRRPPSPMEFMRDASAQNAQLTESLINRVHTLGEENAALSTAMSEVTDDQCSAEICAKHDPLTGLLNRRGFADVTDYILERANAGGDPLAVVMLDLDYLKEVNDTYGHACGDIVLRKVADCLRAGTRQSDVLCRWGGDEMLVVLTGLSGADAAAATVKRIQNAVACQPVDWCGRPVRITTSAGLRWVERVDDTTDLTELLNEADQRLYQAKKNRRRSNVSQASAHIDSHKQELRTTATTQGSDSKA